MLKKYLLGNKCLNNCVEKLHWLNAMKEFNFKFIDNKKKTACIRKICILTTNKNLFLKDAAAKIS